MYPSDAPLLVLIGIPAIAVAVAAAFVLAWRRALGETLKPVAIAVGWFAMFGVLAGTGLLARTDARPPPAGLMVLLLLVGAFGFALSRPGRAIAHGLPLAALVGVQAFRLPLELVMHEAATAGVMPPQMTYTGLNFDIVTGITAALLAPLVAMDKAPRALVVAWNVLGLVLVAVISVIGVASTPLFQAFGPDRVNSWVLYVPFVWLPGVLVAAAVAGHVLVFRKLFGAPAT